MVNQGNSKAISFLVPLVGAAAAGVAIGVVAVQRWVVDVVDRQLHRTLRRAAAPAFMRRQSGLPYCEWKWDIHYLWTLRSPPAPTTLTPFCKKNECPPWEWIEKLSEITYILHLAKKIYLPHGDSRNLKYIVLLPRILFQHLLVELIAVKFDEFPFYS